MIRGVFISRVFRSDTPVVSPLHRFATRSETLMRSKRSVLKAQL